MVSLALQPGECIEFSNPCDDHEWQRFDGFRLCDPYPNGLFLEATREPTARFLCAAAGMPQILDEPVDYFYVRRFDNGVGTFRISVGLEVIATASAEPSTIAPGGSSQLDVIVEGGTPPYSVSWSPAAFLDNSVIDNPIASPLHSTTFTVVVTDSSGLQAQAMVNVNVGLGVEVSAGPPVIDPGGVSTLVAIVQGGTGPYTYAWSPPETLDDPTSATPMAMPEHTTTYAVLATDSLGFTAIGAVALPVNLVATPFASPPILLPGESSQLGVGVLGGAPPYTYFWTPAADLDTPVAQAPLATPSVSTTYTVTVTDSQGAQAVETVEVGVDEGTLAACFTILPLPPVPFVHPVQLDGSCSTGNIVEYRWWPTLNFAGQPPTDVTSGPLSSVFQYEEEGTVTVRLEVVDDTGATALADQIYQVVIP
jgi:hypothetical protein